jgi:DNA invertase Pin-like site-specific DNA recombinase
MNTAKRTALVYARASADPSDQRISVDRQIKLCTARADQLWPDAEIRVFRDDAVTAADPSVHRPGYMAFLAAVRSAPTGQIVGVVVNEQSRLTRQGTGSWDELVVTLTKAGITKVETLRSGPISVEPGNRLVGRLLAVVDAEEVERTKARCQVAHRELFEEGRPSGPAPFGYRSAKDSDGRPTFVPDPDEAKVVRQIFDWAVAGHGMGAIADRLNAANIAPRSARWRFKDGRSVTRWHRVSVRYVLRSAAVAGLRSHTDANGQVHIVPAQWPALIDVEQWKAVQRVLGQPGVVLGANGDTYRVRAQPRAQPRKHLLSGGRRRSGVTGQPGEVYGVLRCGRCDQPLVAQSQGRRDGSRVPAYACRPNAGGCGGVSISPAGEVDELVVKAIQRRLGASPGLRQRLEAATDAEAGRWRAVRDAAKGRMLDAATLYGAGSVDRDAFMAINSAAKAEHDLAERHLGSMASDTALPSAEEVGEGWEQLTLRQKRAVIERLIGRITVYPAKGFTGFDPRRLSEPEWSA